MKIGIFGGSFNPPHKMHLDIALNLISKNYLDKVIYIPTGDSYNKKGLINFKDRYKMVELMISDYNNLLISDVGNNEIYKYTYQTLDYFKSIYRNEELYFICGTDNLNEFYTWKEYEYILENYKLLVIKRNDDDIDSILNLPFWFDEKYEHLFCASVFKFSKSEIEETLSMKEWENPIYKPLLTSSIWKSNLKEIKKIIAIKRLTEPKYIKLLTPNIWNSNSKNIEEILDMSCWNEKKYEHLLTSKIWSCNAESVK